MRIEAMSVDTKPPSPEGLEACPFCGDTMKVRGHSAFHPTAIVGKPWCWLTTAGEFGGPYELSETNYAAWNRRSVSAPVAPEKCCNRADADHCPHNDTNFPRGCKKYEPRRADIEARNSATASKTLGDSGSITPHVLGAAPAPGTGTEAFAWQKKVAEVVPRLGDNADARAILEAAAIGDKMAERLGRYEGRLCLICGAKEPCDLDKGEMSPCTFDPNPIDAAKAFLKRATEAAAALLAAQKQVAYWQEVTRQTAKRADEEHADAEVAQKRIDQWGHDWNRAIEQRDQQIARANALQSLLTALEAVVEAARAGTGDILSAAAVCDAFDHDLLAERLRKFAAALPSK